MELWIRSQDKEKLIKVENLFTEYNGDVDPELCPYSIVTDKCVELGIYKNYERALEVLDEIQNIILLKDMYEYDKESLHESWENMPKEEIQEIRRQLGVYEMPKE